MALVSAAFLGLVFPSGVRSEDAAPISAPAPVPVPAVAPESPAEPAAPGAVSPAAPATPAVPAVSQSGAPTAPGATVPSRLPVAPPPTISAAPAAAAAATAAAAAAAVISAPAEEKKPDIVLSPGEVDFQVSRNKETDVEPAARDIFQSLPGEEGRSRSPIPEGLGSRVEKWLNYFQSGGRSRFETYLSRSGKYAKLMQDILNKYGLPGDLIYLALIESGFSPKAYSVAAAAGPWQFIATTGKRYGLKIDWWADERRDYEKSTHAAASYLRDLYGMFDSWQLATAAYNAGEGKISRAVDRYKSNEYAQLIKYGYLAQETKDYVPKMLAAQTIAKEPAKYGFGGVEYQEPLEFDKVEVPGGIDLAAVGEIIGVPYESLREWNPELRRFCTPPNRSSYLLRVPLSYGRVVQEHLDEIREEAKVTFVLHSAAKGETIDSLAEKYDASPAAIRELNGFTGNSLRKSTKLVIPVTGLGPEDAVPGKELSADQLQMAQMRSDDGRRGKRGRRHAAGSSVKARKGDTLSKIAKRAGVSVSALAKANGLKSGSRVKAGVRLKVPGRGADEDSGLKILAKSGKADDGDSGKEEASRSPGKASRHVVRKGDTLKKIAREHGVSVEELSRRNKLKSGRKLPRGRVLIIPSES
ncbi:MAG TPA: LysM peptidoglycan-binding domain-containing protein [Candidatus Deferrimicrobiaceae bacterium]